MFKNTHRKPTKCLVTSTSSKIILTRYTKTLLPFVKTQVFLRAVWLVQYVYKSIFSAYKIQEGSVRIHIQIKLPARLLIPFFSLLYPAADRD